MNVTMTDNAIAFDGTSPDGCGLGGLEKAFARPAAGGAWITAINQISDQIQLDGVDWLHWSARSPSDTKALTTFRKPPLLYEVKDNGNVCFSLWCCRKLLDARKPGGASPFLMERMVIECTE